MMVACNWLCIERGNFGGRVVWERLVAVNKQGVVFVTATFGEKEQEVVILTLRKTAPAPAIALLHTLLIKRLLKHSPTIH